MLTEPHEIYHTMCMYMYIADYDAYLMPIYNISCRICMCVYLTPSLFSLYTLSLAESTTGMTCE